MCQHLDASPGSDGSPTDDADGAASITCNNNADCTAANTVCKQGTHTCLSLTTPDCPDVLGDYKNENAIVFGAILPTVLTHAPDYLSTLAQTGTSIKAGLSLAVDDFASDKNPRKGVPPAPGKTEARPVAFVVCSDNATVASTTAATTHLVSTVGVPAIVGTAFSTYTRVITSTLAGLGRSDVLLMVPRSTDFGPTDNGGLFRRLAPVDSVQGEALSALFASREPSLRAALGDAGAGTLKVALVYKEDAYGNGVAAAVKASLKFNGLDAAANGANFRELKYGNSDSENYSPQFPSVTLGIVNARPHAVILVGTNEAIPGILAEVERGWSEGTYRPHYFLSDGVVVKDLWEYLGANDPGDSTRKRILATMVTGTSARFGAFASAYAAASPQATSIVYGAAGAYDAVYMLAYSAAGIGDKPVTGPNLLEGFQLLAPGGGALQVGVGADAIESTFSKLSSGQAVNLEGASSSLDFDATSGAVTGVTTQVLCIPTASGKAQQAVASGLTITAGNVVQGALSAACD